MGERDFKTEKVTFLVQTINVQTTYIHIHIIEKTKKKSLFLVIIIIMASEVMKEGMW